MVEAEYQLVHLVHRENAQSINPPTSSPQGALINVPLWSVIPLSRERTFLYGRVQGCDVIGDVEGQGGRKNHTIAFRGGEWALAHCGHSLPILVNGERTMRGGVLRTGDQVVPGPGIEFIFSLTAQTHPIIELIETEGPAVLERPEPLIDRIIELLGCDVLRAQRVLKAAIARTRLPATPETRAIT